MILYKKLKRDLIGKKESNLAVIVLIAIGITVFSAFDMLGANLVDAQQSFYRSCNFADGFIDIQSIPYQKIKSLKQIEGISQIEGHIAETFRMNFSRSRDDIYIRLMSYDDSVNQVNQFLLQDGAYPKSGKNEILLDSNFAEYNHLSVGDTIYVVYNGTENPFTVSGTGASPEFIYALKDVRDIVPDYSTYGIGITSLRTMEKMTSLNQSYNNIVFTLKEGYEFTDVSEVLKSLLKHYSVSSIISREHQTSHTVVDDEIKECNTTSRILPSLFLLISSMIQIMMLERLVQSQRTQIGIMKAFGYSERQIQFHYIMFAVILGIVGSVLGILLSVPILYSFVDMYGNFFNFPYISKALSMQVFGISLLTGTLFSVFAGYLGAKKILSLSPLDAFKAEEPHYVQKKTFLDSFTFLFHTFGKMSLRNISRNRKRSFFILIGITLSFALTSVMFMMYSLWNTVITDKYSYNEIYTGKMEFQRVVNKSDAMLELKKRQEVSEIESLLEVPVSFQYKNHIKEVNIIGVEQHSDLYHIVDVHNHEVPIQNEEVFLSHKLAEVLQVQVGDMVYVESSFMKKRKKVPVQVTKIIPQSVGVNAYMSQETLERLLDRKNIATSLIFHASKETVEQLRKDYDESNIVSNVVHTGVRKQKMLDFMAHFQFMMYTFSSLGVIMCFIVIYNSYIISIAERNRELSSLLVLGMSRKEVAQIIALEQQIIAFFGVLFGLPLTKVLLKYVSVALSDDNFSIPTTIIPSKFAISLLCIVVSMVLAQYSGRKKINELVIVEVLKERE